MNKDKLDILRKFCSDEIDVSSFLTILEEWNRSGFWQDLSKAEYKLLSNYFHVYADMYGGTELGKFSSWEKLKQKMKGYPDVDLKTLKRGTAELIASLERIAGIDLTTNVEPPNGSILKPTFSSSGIRCFRVSASA